MIIKDIEQLKTKCEPIDIHNLEEADLIAARLLNELGQNKNGIGLAANQIGINKRVCVVNVKEPIVFVNPKIVKRSQETFVFPEGCLSFPNKHIRTTRNVTIEVESDNHPDNLTFTANSEDVKDAFECACVQHEIDHLDGITMFDRQVKGVTIKREGKKIGRNDKVTIEKGTESKVLKYKKAQPMLEDGWTLVGQ